MGLDQYAKWTNSEGNTEDFKYWRKTSHIQNWMQQLYAKKTGVTDPSEFNCVSVDLTEQDIMQFVKDVKENKMQCVQGFFFGYTYDPSEDKHEDLRFAADALVHIWMGNKVEYSSWW